MGGDPEASAFQQERIEIYKVYVDAMEKLVARRLAVNVFFISLNTLLMAGVVVTAKGSEVLNQGLLFLGATVMSAAGFLVSIVWKMLLSNYEVISGAKFDVLHALEGKLAEAPFLEEKKVLKTKNYRSSSRIEGGLPVIFGLVYLVLGGAAGYVGWTTPSGSTPRAPAAAATTASAGTR